MSRMSTTVLIRNQEINNACSGISSKYSGRKEDYFALLYLMKKFNLTLEEAASQVCFGGNECAIDAFYHDKGTRNLYLFQFKWSENHLLFKDSFEKLVLIGIERIFGHSMWRETQNQFLIKLISCISENKSVIDRILIHFVYNGDPIKAEQSKVLDLLRENLESKKYIIDGYFGRQVDMIFQVVSNKKTLGHPFLKKQSAVYPVAFDRSLKVASGSNELIVTFVSLEDLYKMYSELGEKFFEKNIRCGLNDGGMTSHEIKMSLNRILAGEEPIEHFTFYHNGVALTAQELEFDSQSVRMTEPRLLNGVQTVKTIKGLVDKDKKRGIKLRKLLRNVNVMARIVRSRDEEFLKRVTINNNRQNPIMPWNLRANDLIQLHLEERLSDELHIFYERRENSLRNLSDEELEDMNIGTKKSIQICKLAQTLLALHGEVDRISKMKEVFESQRWYNDTFREKYLTADLRKLVVLYKVHYRIPAIVKEIQYLQHEKYSYVGKIRNLLWCLAIQGLLNDEGLTDHVQTYGTSLVTEANFNYLLKSIASIKLRLILRDTFDDRKYQRCIDESKYSFLKTKAAYNDCMKVAGTKFNWKIRDL
ncbi:MAG: hypothetical protein E6K92_08980 [Thaumarchaeota archaeon]|nr:MAG: hypothetical protein E6K92_08980 [Nitrososphaerota archaeon]